MAVYIVLGNYTEQGVRNIKNVANLRQAAEQWTAQQGGRVLGNYMTLGPYDFVFIVELPSPEAALEGAFTFGSQREVRTQTMLAFTTEAPRPSPNEFPSRLSRPPPPPHTADAPSIALSILAARTAETASRAKRSGRCLRLQASSRNG